MVAEVIKEVPVIQPEDALKNPGEREDKKPKGETEGVPATDMDRAGLAGERATEQRKSPERQRPRPV